MSALEEEYNFKYLTTKEILLSMENSQQCMPYVICSFLGFLL